MDGDSCFAVVDDADGHSTGTSQRKTGSTYLNGRDTFQPLAVEDVETIVFLLAFVGVYRQPLRCHHLRHAMDNVCSTGAVTLLFWRISVRISCLVASCQTLTPADPQVVVQTCVPELLTHNHLT